MKDLYLLCVSRSIFGNRFRSASIVCLEMEVLKSLLNDTLNSLKSEGTDMGEILMQLRKDLIAMS
jgi:hypothetical protein